MYELSIIYRIRYRINNIYIIIIYYNNYILNKSISNLTLKKKKPKTIRILLSRLLEICSITNIILLDFDMNTTKMLIQILFPKILNYIFH